MSLSLREQLLQAGLVTTKQVKQAQQQESKQRPKGKFNPNAKSDRQLALEKAQAEKAAQDKELNRLRQEKADRKARMTQLWQLVDQNRVPRIESDEYFNFVHANKVHRIGVDAVLRERIQNGQVIIVRYGKFYAPVLPEIAERVKALDAEAIVDLKSAPPTSDTATDEAYKDFVVPDDLMW
jgi:hypothetical protein